MPGASIKFTRLFSSSFWSVTSAARSRRWAIRRFFSGFCMLHILPEMAFASAILLVLYFILDRYYYRRESQTAAPQTDPEPLSIEGKWNFLFLAGIIGAVLFSGSVKLGEVSIAGVSQNMENFMKDAALLVMGI